MAPASPGAQFPLCSAASLPLAAPFRAPGSVGYAVGAPLRGHLVGGSMCVSGCSTQLKRLFPETGGYREARRGP